MNLFLTQTAYADTPVTVASAAVPAAAPVAPQPSTLGMMLPFAAMAIVFYFLLIRPQNQKMKEQEKLVNNLQKGEEVITRAGIIGKIHGIAEKFITLEVDTNVRIKVLKSQIETVLRAEQKA
jgi:preprotein translocase subunit YajC